MTRSQNRPLPRNTWRILGITAIVLLILTVTAIGFISAGFFDPKPAGQIRTERSLQTIAVGPAEQRITWLDDLLTAENFSLRLTAAFESGDMDSGYGLAVGSEEEAFVIALSPTGYVTIQTQSPAYGQPISSGEKVTTDELDNMIANGPGTIDTAEVIVPLIEWQPWPHIKGGTEKNDIWLDKENQTVTIRINGELYWTGLLLFQTHKAGLWTAAFNQSAVIDFQSITIFTE